MLHGFIELNSQILYCFFLCFFQSNSYAGNGENSVCSSPQPSLTPVSKIHLLRNLFLCMGLECRTNDYEN